MAPIGDGVNDMISCEEKYGGDEAYSGGMTAWEREFIDGNDGVVITVDCIGRARSTNEEFEETGDDEIEEGAEDERDEEVGMEGRGRGSGEEE